MAFRGMQWLGGGSGLVGLDKRGVYISYPSPVIGSQPFIFA